MAYDPKKLAKGIIDQLYLQSIVDKVEANYQDQAVEEGEISPLEMLVEPAEEIFSEEYKPADLEKQWAYAEPVKVETPVAYDEVEEAESQLGVLSETEAAEMVERKQASYMFPGAISVLSLDDKERFHAYQMFNKTALMFHHANSPFRTDNVDYSK
tara:strand:+ start:514 stop:981 length:468 start_codon:yes stop_codon:yes gene_type:complete